MAVSSAELAIVLSAKDQASATIGKVGGKLKGLGGFGKVAKVGLLAAGAGAAVVGAGLFKLGADFDKAFDAIAIGTGAVGPALEGLKSDFKSVFKAIPTDMASASQAVADFNTLTGATGPALQDMAKNALEGARMLGEDSSALIAAAGKAFNVFEVDAKDGAAALDAVFVASQATGVPMTGLLTLIQRYGPVLKNLGLDLNETTAIFGSLQKAGIDVSRVMPGINAAMRKMADEGVTDMAGGLKDVFARIRDAKTESEALNIATSAFGAEGAQRLSVAVRTGALDVDELTASLEASEGAIMDTSRQTESLSQKFTRFKNNLMVAVQPAATAVFDGLAKLADLIEKHVVPIVKGFAEVFGAGLTGDFQKAHGAFLKLPKPLWDIAQVVFKLGSWIRRELIPAVKEIAVAIGEWAERWGPVILRHLQEFGRAIFDLYAAAIPMIIEAVGRLMDVWRALYATVLEPYVIPILRKVGAFLLEHKPILVAVAATILLLTNPWLAVAAAIVVVLAKWDEIKAVFTEAIPNAVNTALEWIKQIPIIGPIFEDTFNTVKAIVELVVGAVIRRLEFLFTTIKGLFDIFKGVLTGDWDLVWQGVRDIFNGFVDLFLGDVRGLWTAANDIIGSKVDLAVALFEDLTELALGALRDLRRKAGVIITQVLAPFRDLRDLIGDIIGWVEDLIDAIGKIKLPSLGGIGGAIGGALGFQHGGLVPPGVVQPAVLHGGKYGEVVAPLGPQATPAGPGGMASGLADAIAAAVAAQLPRALEGVRIDLDGEAVGRIMSRRQGSGAFMLSRGG